MLYSALKIYVRLLIHLFTNKIVVNKPDLLKTEGPLLIASNHPNSFLDAIIYDILFDIPIWSLARGDAFKNKSIAKILHKLKILPVYRTREGAENLNENYKTFNQCIEIFKKDECVLIFSEALCVNEWHLRPLKKGTARLAFQAWENGLPLKVLPAGINYSSFRRYGKKIDVNFGNIITVNQFNLSDTDGNKNAALTKLLTSELQHLVYEIKSGDNEKHDQVFGIKPNKLKELSLFIPSIFAALVHYPIYFFASYINSTYVKDKDHYDSVMLGLLIVSYPAYLLLITGGIWVISKSLWSLITIIILPLSLLTYVKRKIRKDKSFSN